MDTDRREFIRRSLRNLVESYAAHTALMEGMLDLLCREFALDPLDYFRRRAPSAPQDAPPSSAAGLPVVDRRRLTVAFGGRTCFLGNTLLFRLLARLSERAGSYLTYEELFADVWQGTRSEDAVRSVVKTLRQKLRGPGWPTWRGPSTGPSPGITPCGSPSSDRRSHGGHTAIPLGLPQPSFIMWRPGTSAPRANDVPTPERSPGTRPNPHSRRRASGPRNTSACRPSTSSIPPPTRGT